MSRLRKMGLLALLGCLLGAACVELLARVSGISCPVFLVPDAELGAWHASHFQGWQQSEGRAYVRFNEFGMHGPSVTLKKPSRTRRIAFLGDSFTEAIQLPYEEGFVARCAESLSALSTAGEAVETLNFGCSGFGTAQAYLTLQRRVAPFQADMVVLVFFVGNDFRNNSQKLEPDRLRPFFLLHGEELVLDESFQALPEFRSAISARGQALRFCINHSRALQIPRYFRSVQAGNVDRRGLDLLSLGPPRDADHLEAWRITEQILLRLRDESRSQGAPLLVVIVGTADQVDPSPEFRRAFAAQLQMDDLDYAQNRLQSFLQAQGVPTLSLVEPLRAYAQEHRVFLHGSPSLRQGGHWNTLGHKIAAEKISQWLAGKLR